MRKTGCLPPGVLGEALDNALKTLQARHTQESAEARYLAAIVDDSPSALLTRVASAVISDGCVCQLFTMTT